MIVVNVFEAKAKLSEYLELVSGGERVLICKRNRPIAELRPVETSRTTPRPIGVAQGRLEIPDSFFEPLPEDLLDAFDGVGEAARPSQVAEGAPPAYGAGRTTKRRSRR
jgi:prevent-host-death family protein